jgi:metallo-beta-lactamase class B
MSTVAEENGREYNVVIVCSIRLGTGVPLIGNKNYPNIAEDMENALKTLKNVPADVWLVSHSYMFGMAEKIKRMEEGSAMNPFIDPDGYRAYLAENETVLHTQLERERTGGPPYAVRIPPPAICPEDGRTCY